MTLPNKRLILIMLSVPALLLIPFIAMQLTQEVNWSLFDFLVAGVLLTGAGLLLELVLRKVTTLRYRLMLSAAVFIALLLVWAELAVGVFGTPFAGN
ncbi:hypothetical protein SAMN05421788_102395 [Filimonas lacunae]|uniref:Uncharacterized protein n=1 Tax=Filimonas lacunae TaxID=477680 RepID=A0A173MHK8_9BACT|nr:hypothetical protein [Filimonas lacunae]BAV06976.1 hypothetical protein FLA_2996 [Filimonas lacunae]SIS96991.1 hypothetical protein SAMN05421788_102395 [Filimonas lacunae]